MVIYRINRGIRLFSVRKNLTNIVETLGMEWDGNGTRTGRVKERELAGIWEQGGTWMGRGTMGIPAQAESN